jgi:hypothetical protein
LVVYEFETLLANSFGMSTIQLLDSEQDLVVFVLRELVVYKLETLLVPNRFGMSKPHGFEKKTSSYLHGVPMLRLPDRVDPHWQARKSG